jgi:hypothetical protein
MTLPAILLIIAIILFIAHTFGVESRGINLHSAGLALMAAAFLAPIV